MSRVKSTKQEAQQRNRQGRTGLYAHKQTVESPIPVSSVDKAAAEHVKKAASYAVAVEVGTWQRRQDKGRVANRNDRMPDVLAAVSAQMEDYDQLGSEERRTLLKTLSLSHLVPLLEPGQTLGSEKIPSTVNEDESNEGIGRAILARRALEGAGLPQQLTMVEATEYETAFDFDSGIAGITIRIRESGYTLEAAHEDDHIDEWVKQARTVMTYSVNKFREGFTGGLSRDVAEHEKKVSILANMSQAPGVGSKPERFSSWDLDEKAVGLRNGGRTYDLRLQDNGATVHLGREEVDPLLSQALLDVIAKDCGLADGDKLVDTIRQGFNGTPFHLLKK